MEVSKEEHNRIMVGNNKTGFITSQTVEANLLYAILEKLEEVRCGLIDVEDKEINTSPIDKIRVAFFHQLEAKTGWGRNEIKEIFETAIESAS